jgi:hypothetical protein
MSEQKWDAADNDGTRQEEGKRKGYYFAIKRRKIPLVIDLLIYIDTDC